ncbi:MAG TPA: ATP-binding protein [Candidatus Limnocylindria bacterium]|jgi:signal transduction histidine kinase|nr:ATP-binding protein [Candidatus Limnocylindria bacterium]
MESTGGRLPALDVHLERQMRSQERQLAVVRGAIAGAALVAIVLLRSQLTSFPWLAGLAVAAMLYSAGILLLVGRFPAREVGILATALDMIVVTLAIYAEPDALDAFLFYLPVLLGVALRFGLAASIWASVVIGFMYGSVVLAATGDASPARELVGVRLAYVLGFGLAAGLYARVATGRAAENAQLQQRLSEEERERMRRRESELLTQMAREFGTSLDRRETARAIVQAAAPLLGDLTWLLIVERADPADPASLRMSLADAAGRDPDAVERLRAHLAERKLRLGEGVAGAAAGTATPVLGQQPLRADAGDPDGITTLGLRSLLAAPIVWRGTLRGVLASGSTAGPLLGDGELRLASAIAERAAPALDNAALWGDLQEQVRREQRAQRVKDDFLSIVSHELRTPLTSIQGYAQLLEARIRDSSGPKELSQMRVIRSQVTRMRRLVEDLLDVSRIDRRGGVSIEPQAIDLAEEIREAVARTGREHPERSITATVPDELPIRADRDRIGQVLTNLLDNAVKYSPDGGPVAVRAEASGDRVQVSVLDTGIGIGGDQADAVFERFFQADADAGRRFGGLGLGLYITRAIVEAHGGEISAQPNPEADHGTLIRFTIPRVARVAAAVEAYPPFVARPG